MKTIILLNGLIASGKSTIGKELVKKLTERNKKAAFYDMDDEVKKLNPEEKWEFDEDKRNTWLLARRNVASYTLDSLKEVDYVIVVGPFYYKDEITGYIKYITPDIDLYLFTLNTSLEKRLERNTQRIPSNDPQDLMHQEKVLEDSPPQPYSLPIQNNGSTEEAVQLILRAVNKGEGKLDKSLFE